MARYCRFWLLAVAVLLCPGLAPAAAAQAVFGPGDPPLDLGRAWQVVIPPSATLTLRPEVPRIEIASVEAHVSIMELTARTGLEVTLSNPAPAPAEAILLLPVPDGAVVSSFLFEGQATEPTARVLPRDEARRLYESIVAKVRDPALLEFAGWNLVRSSVFPVPAGGKQRVRIVYDHILESDGNRVDYLLPRSESLDRRLPWSISVDVRAGQPVSTVYSPSHAIETTRRNEREVTIRLAAGAALEAGPFRLSYLLERDGVSASLFAYPDPEVGGGYFLLMAGLPARIDEKSTRLRREVTVVIDRSGSMAGAKMDQARAAALQVVAGLAPGEAFNIIDYASTVSSFAPAPLVKDDKTTLDARRYLETIRPGGGTNIHDALLEALRQKPSDSMVPIVLFLTDGLPTIGVTGEADIRRMVEQGNPHRRRIFTFGVGADVNVPLLDHVATASRATSTYVLPQEDVEVKVARVFRQLYGPVFAEPVLTIRDTSGQESTRLVQELIPATLSDLFEGDQLIVLGQYRGNEPATFHLAGNYLGVAKDFDFTFGFEAASTRHAFVPRLWASRRIAFLIDEIRRAGAELTGRPAVVGQPLLGEPRFREIVEEIVRLSTRFGILTEYTSFLATEGTDLSNWEELASRCTAWLDQRAVRTRAGVGAINQGLNCQSQLGQVTLNSANRYLDERLEQVELGGVQQVCDLAFFRRGSSWIDSRLVNRGNWSAPDRVIDVGSTQHFALLERLAGSQRQGALSLAGDVVIEMDGEIVLVKGE